MVSTRSVFSNTSETSAACCSRASRLFSLNSGSFVVICSVSGSVSSISVSGSVSAISVGGTVLFPGAGAVSETATCWEPEVPVLLSDLFFGSSRMMPMISTTTPATAARIGQSLTPLLFSGSS